MEKKINLLFVDDEEVFLESMKKRLEMRGFNVVAVNRGEKALEEAELHPFDIAVIDLKMPGINGEDTLVELKNKHPMIQVIILTGHGSMDSAVECTRAGARKYLQKPCDFEKLYEALADAYKINIMRKRQLGEEHISDILKAANATSPVDILRRLRELDRD